MRLALGRVRFEAVISVSTEAGLTKRYGIHMDDRGWKKDQASSTHSSSTACTSTNAGSGHLLELALSVYAFYSPATLVTIDVGATMTMCEVTRAPHLPAAKQ